MIANIRAACALAFMVAATLVLAPLLAVLFFIPAMNLAGIPPLSGFLGKLGLLRAGIEDGGVLAYLLVAGGTLTSLLTLYALAKAWNLAFWRAATPEMCAVGTVLDTSEGNSPEEGEGDGDSDDSGNGNGGTEAPGPGGQSGPSGPRDDGAVGNEGDGGAVAVRRPRRKVTPTFGGQEITTSSTLPASMTGSTIALVLFGLAFTVAAGPLFGLTDRAAHEVMARTPYVEAVVEAVMK